MYVNLLRSFVECKPFLLNNGGGLASRNQRLWALMREGLEVRQFFSRCYRHPGLGGCKYSPASPRPSWKAKRRDPTHAQKCYPTESFKSHLCGHHPRCARHRWIRIYPTICHPHSLSVASECARSDLRGNTDNRS